MAGRRLRERRDQDRGHATYREHHLARRSRLFEPGRGGDVGAPKTTSAVVITPRSSAPAATVPMPIHPSKGSEQQKSQLKEVGRDFCR